MHSLPSPRHCDRLILGGTVLDGSGTPGRLADVAVQGDRVAAVGDLRGWTAGQIHRADGRVVAPGFIDAHTHDDLALLTAPEMAAKVSQGVTTVIVGNCGLSLAPLTADACRPLPAPFSLLGTREDYHFPTLEAYVDRLVERPAAVNVGILVGHGNLRASTMTRLDRPASAAETERMEALARSAFETGALGISSGLAYEASRCAQTGELVALAAVAAAHGGVYVTHLRDEGDLVAEAVAEALEIGRRSGCAVVISHHKCLFRRNWGRTRETLAAIDAARAGQSVAMDVYPYVASSTVLSLDRVGEAERVLVAWSERQPEAVGRDLDALALEWSCSRGEAALRLMPGGAVYFNMNEDDLRRILLHPCCMIGSDGVPSHPHPHPRLWGTFPRVLGRYVREDEVLSLEAAVHKMTGLPARVFGLRDRGSLKPGAFADVTVFDPAAILDEATFERPTEPSRGIELVLVNGQPVFAGGSVIGPGAGRVLTRQGSDEAAGARAASERSCRVA